MFSRITLLGEPVQFIAGSAHFVTLGGRSCRLFMNQTKHLSRLFGYVIFDYDGTVLKYARNCSLDTLRKAVVMN